MTITWDEADAVWRWDAAGAASAVFSTRAQGNVGANVGDHPVTVGANRTRVAALAGLDVEHVAGVTQVHGADVWLDFALDDRLIEAVRWSGGESPVHADALVTRRAGVGVAVTVADCLPVALSWGDATAAVHAGWRGLVGGVLEAAVNAMRHAAGMSAFLDGVELRAAIGPSLGPCCFEVGAEVAERFPDDCIVHGEDGSLQLDARRAARHRLEALGAIVEVLDVCARCDERCYSHRGDAPGPTGRQAVVVQRPSLS